MSVFFCMGGNDSKTLVLAPPLELLMWSASQFFILELRMPSILYSQIENLIDYKWIDLLLLLVVCYMQTAYEVAI